MRKIKNILWKLLGFVVAILTNTHSFANAPLRRPLVTPAREQETVKTKRYYFCGANKKNQYVKRCGGSEVGINWLRSATNIDGDIVSITFSTSTKNSSETIENFKKYINSANNNTNITLTFSDVSESLNANDQLTTLCSPYNEDGTKKEIECATCPGAGILEEASYVDINYNENTVMPYTWKFYTIAHCFLNEYTDTEGTFYYQDTLTGEHEKCYYSPDTDDI